MSINAGATTAAEAWRDIIEIERLERQQAERKLRMDSSEECAHSTFDGLTGKCYTCGKKGQFSIETGVSREQPSATWEPRLLKEAIAAITGARNGDYGDPWDNHGNTAEVWQWWIKCRFMDDEVKLTALDVCMMNILQKASRLSHSPEHWDSICDVAGFAGNMGACIDHEKGCGK